MWQIPKKITQHTIFLQDTLGTRNVGFLYSRLQILQNQDGKGAQSEHGEAQQKQEG